MFESKQTVDYILNTGFFKFIIVPIGIFLIALFVKDFIKLKYLRYKLINDYNIAEDKEIRIDDCQGFVEKITLFYIKLKGEDYF